MLTLLLNLKNVTVVLCLQAALFLMTWKNLFRLYENKSINTENAKVIDSMKMTLSVCSSAYCLCNNIEVYFLSLSALRLSKFKN